MAASTASIPTQHWSPTATSLPPLADRSGRRSWSTERLPVVSYPYEWSFGMLKDAALLQLDVTRAALDEEMTLKDATVVQRPMARRAPHVHRHRVVHGRTPPGEPWAGYRQFCETFLYPAPSAGVPGHSVPPLAAGPPRRDHGRAVPVVAVRQGPLAARRAGPRLPAGERAGPLRRDIAGGRQAGAARRRLRRGANQAQHRPSAAHRRAAALGIHRRSTWSDYRAGAFSYDDADLQRKTGVRRTGPVPRGAGPSSGTSAATSADLLPVWPRSTPTTSWPSMPTTSSSSACTSPSRPAVRRPSCLSWLMSPTRPPAWAGAARSAVRSATVEHRRSFFASLSCTTS